MTQSKHTQGPWGVMISGNQVFVNSEDECVCITHNNDVHPPEKEKANARLIAAAPDLLEACHLAMRELSEFYTKDQSEALETLKKAIAKTEGGIE